MTLDHLVDGAMASGKRKHRGPATLGKYYATYEHMNIFVISLLVTYVIAKVETTAHCTYFVLYETSSLCLELAAR